MKLIDGADGDVGRGWMQSGAQCLDLQVVWRNDEDVGWAQRMLLRVAVCKAIASEQVRDQALSCGHFFGANIDAPLMWDTE